MCVAVPNSRLFMGCLFAGFRLPLPTADSTKVGEAQTLLVALNRLVNPARYQFTPVLSIATRVNALYVDTDLLKAALKATHDVKVCDTARCAASFALLIDENVLGHNSVEGMARVVREL